MRLQLAKDDMLLELDPFAGGAVSALKLGDIDLLRRGPDRCGPAYDVRRYAAFPMVPFIGRIQNGVFTLDGQQYILPANMPPEPHAIHGHGWQAPWSTETQTKTSATLLYEHAANAWPWSYETRQQFEIMGDALRLTLSVVNLSDSLMPAGLGWHPYFYRKAATLSVPTIHVWSPDEATGENRRCSIAPGRDLSHTQPVEALQLDTAYSVTPGAITLAWPKYSIVMTSDPVFGHATVYVPPGEDFFCVEPISHAPNAINSPLSEAETGLKWLGQGETLSGTISLSVER